MATFNNNYNDDIFIFPFNSDNKEPKDFPITHPLLGEGTIKGVFGGCLWFLFDDDEGKISTTLVSEVQYLHKWLKITKGGNSRSIKY